MAPYLCGFLLLAVTVGTSADPFLGEFAGQHDGLEVTLSLSKSDDGRHTGNIRVDDQLIPVVGERHGKQLVGKVSLDGKDYEFVAVNETGVVIFAFDDGDTMVFRTSGAAASNAPSDANVASTEGTLSAREVYINRVKLDLTQLQALEALYQTRIEDGSYWYDALCGAWGVDGGPAASFILPGLDLPGPMPADVSGGGTGIFINGREIHPVDQRGLQQLFGVTYAGRYWLDAQGNLGTEGGPALVNIVAALKAAQNQSSQGQSSQSQQSGSVTHGYNTGSQQRGTLASDGQGGHIYSGRTASGKSVFWYPGM